MILPLKEVDVLGVFVAPFSVCLPIAFLATLAVLGTLRRVTATVVAGRSPLLELATFVLVLSGLVLLLGRV